MATDLTGDASGVDDFAHLHLHTQYSLLDGAIRMSDLCGKVQERGMKSVAMTDHGNMFGAIQFYQQAKAHGVKPIFGCEAYIADGEAKAKTDRKNYHIVLLAKNEVGYKNLQRLVSYGHLEGFYYNPRIDREVLREHREGLIGLSACLGGHISRLITGGDMDTARDRIREYADIFEPGSYYLELQPNRLEAQERVNAHLAQLGEDLGVPLVGTNDCHYVDESEAYAHDVLMCMGMGRTINDEKRLKHDCTEFFIKTPQEMWGYFERYPEAMHNASRIASMCNVELKLGQPELPDFKLPEGTDEVAYLRDVAGKGLNERLVELRLLGKKPDEDRYRARLERELGIIIGMKFPGYFLIVWDFIRHAKKIGVPVGPGRGSGAGSLVAYCMRITDIDPLEYNLLFERFLNPERVSMPDFDIDFCMDRREEVIQYVSDLYGKKHVGQIATFHSLKARGLLRDVCRVMEKLPSEANELAKMVPEGPKVSLSLCMADPKAIRAAMKKDPDKASKLEGKLQIAEAASKLRMRCELDPEVRKIVEIGCSLEGLNRHAGMHAAGIVIGNRELTEHVPCFKADDKIVTQYTMTDVETAGLVKFDFLGLKTLTVIKHAVDQINGLPKPWRLDPTSQVEVPASGEVGTSGEVPTFNIEKIPMDDSAVYDMISRGETTGVFQLESSGFKKLLQKLRPDKFEDIIAAVALYRPGPLEGGMVDQFIECKHGRRSIAYPHDRLAEVLRETYGVFVYQEQVMLAAQILAGFSLGGADLMRRAMGKKKVKEMDRQRQLFVDGCAEHSDISAEKANEIFDLIDKFAGYGFNKSHSAAYGLITYQTAYLKHHYPECFMCALMTCDKDKSENVVKFIAESRSMGITVLPPDVNESASDFNVVVRPRPEPTPEERAEAERSKANGKRARKRGPLRATPPDEIVAIRFGMGAVRNVGGNAVESILAARAEEEGPFESLFQLCRRVDLKRVNKRTLEGLVFSGAFDSVSDGHCRSRITAAIDSAVEQGQSSQRDRESGQAGLFDMFASNEVFVEEYPKIAEWAPKQRLLNEREALGFYLTGHPLDRYQQDVDKHASTRIGNLRKELTGQELVLGGVICELRQVTTKAGKTMGFFQLEDQFGRIEVVVFPRTWARSIDPENEDSPCWGDWLMAHGEDPVFVTGKVEAEENDVGDISRFKLLLTKVEPIAEVREARTRRVRLRLRTDQLTSDRILALKHVVANHRGQCSMELEVRAEGQFQTKMVFGDEFRVTADDALFVALERLFGCPVAELA